MKVDLTKLTHSERIYHVHHYHVRKARDARFSNGHQDPYVTLELVKKKFRIDGDDRLVQFEQLFILYEQWLKNRLIKQ